MPSSTRCRRWASPHRHADEPSKFVAAIRDAEEACVNLQYSGEEKIPASVETVWAFVTNPEKVGRSFPDVVDVTVQDPTHLEAVVRVGVGPVRAISS